LKKRKKFVIDVKLKILAWLGRWRADKMQVFGADYLKMNVVLLSVAPLVIALAN
jgi:hypothetical protein